MKSNSLPILLLHILFIFLLQILVFNHVLLFNRLIPYIYPLIILIMPIGTQRVILLFAGFITGLIVDIFSTTYGVHTAAATLMAFLRPYILTQFTDVEEENRLNLPGIRSLGFEQYLFFITIMTFLHHLALFLIDAGGFRDFLYTVFKTFISVIISVILMLIYELALLVNKSDRR